MLQNVDGDFVMQNNANLTSLAGAAQSLATISGQASVLGGSCIHALWIIVQAALIPPQKVLCKSPSKGSFKHIEAGQDSCVTTSDSLMQAFLICLMYSVIM